MARGQTTSKNSSGDWGCLMLLLGVLFILVIARSGGYSITQVISNIVEQFGIHNTG